jgi:hypothetical protein
MIYLLVACLIFSIAVIVYLVRSVLTLSDDFLAASKNIAQLEETLMRVRESLSVSVSAENAAKNENERLARELKSLMADLLYVGNPGGVRGALQRVLDNRAPVDQTTVQGPATGDADRPE